MTQLLQNAAFGTALILAAALLRRVLKDRLVPGARLALWAACLFRLLTPAAPESAFSLWGLSRLFAPQRPPAAYAPGFVPAAGAPAPAPQPDPGIPWEMALLVLWLAVGGALAARYVLSWRRTRRAVACAILLDRDDPRYAPLPRFARLREGPMEGAPLTFGVARPTVVLSPGLEGEALDCVLAHEGVHAARRDNLWHYVMALALVVHWWNPAVWWMARLLRRDVELSCDRAAVKKLGAERRTDYARALVSLATQESGPAFCQTFGRKATEERIRSVMNFKKTSVVGVIFTLALVVAVTAAFASSPKEPSEDHVDLPVYVEEEGEVGEDIAKLLGEGEINYDVKLPEFDEDGSLAIDGIVGTRFYNYSMVTDSDAISGSDAAPIPTQYAYPRNSKGETYGSGAYGFPDLILAQGTKGEVGYVRDCDSLSGQYGPVNTPEDAMKYMAWLETQPMYYTIPLYDCEGNVIGEFAMTNSSGVQSAPAAPAPTPSAAPAPAPTPSAAPAPAPTPSAAPAVAGYPVCAVDGCTLTGRHDHDGVTYCGGAGHYGGTCDGSCVYCAQQSAASGGHHGQSQSSGHHGNGHH